VDLALYSRVLWRFRVIVLAGFILACILAFFSYARVSFTGGSPTISYRQGETWQSKTRLLITQPGFQIGKLSLGSAAQTFSTPGSGPPVASPQWLASLAESYVQIGNSDAVQARLAREHQVRGTMTVTPESAGPSTASGLLPVLDVNGLGPSPTDASQASQRGAKVLIAYVKQQQRLNGVARNNRVQLQVINRAEAPQILLKRKKTLPIVIFIAVMTAALGLAFILENLRPRVRAVPEEAGEEPRLRKQASA
jgi:hypothetical protein